MAINEKKIRDNISKQVGNDIARQRQAINDSLGTQKKQFDETINRNKSFMNEQISKLNTDRVVGDNRITALQNRRGGFYSGGLDYQLAENLRNTQTAQSGIRRDINDKNQAVLGQYNTLASQAAQNIKMLEQQAPDKIRELVNAELMKQRQLLMEEERMNMEKQRFALEQQMRQLQLSQAKAKGSGGGGGRSSGGRRTVAKTSAPKKATPVARQFQAAKKTSSKTSLDRYYETMSRQLNKERSLARKKVEDIYPWAIPSPRNNKNLHPYERNKIILDSIRGR